MVHYRCKIRKAQKTLTKQVRYELNIDQATKQQFSTSFKHAIENKHIDSEEGYKIMDQALNTAAKTLAEKSPQIKKPWITQETYELIKQKTLAAAIWTTRRSSGYL